MPDAEVSASDKVYEALRAAILRREYRPGDALRRPDIARSFGVSQTPLREAFLRLEREGFILVVPQAGTRVAPIDVLALHQAHFLKTAVECDVVRRLSLRPTIRDLSEVQDLAETTNATPEGFDALDRAFHRSLFVSLGMAQVFDRVQEAMGPLDRCHSLAFAEQAAVDAAIRFHRDILGRVMAADPDGAIQAMRAHISGELSGLGGWQHAHPELFADISV